MARRFDRTFEYEPALRPFNRDHGNILAGRSGRRGPAHHAQEIGALAIPSRRRRDPLLASGNHPLIPIETRGRAHAFARRRRARVGAAARLAGTEARKRRAALLKEGPQEASALLGRTANQDGQEAENGSKHGQRDAGVHAVEFFCQDSHVDEAVSVTAGRRRNAFSQVSRSDHRFVGGPGSQEAFLRRRQRVGCYPDAGEDFLRKLAGFRS